MRRCLTCSCCVLQDEADILGDRIAIMAEGQLRCAGSSLFLKKTYGVGYQLTIEKLKGKQHGKNGEPPVKLEANDEALVDIVQTAVPEASLLSNVGSEMTYQLPMGAASKFGPMFEGLDSEVDKGTVGSYGVSITTLDEVFLLVARGDPTAHQEFASSKRGSLTISDNAERTARSRMDLENEGLFSRHILALIRKRAAFFRRDKKAWCCTTIVPSVFVFLGFIIFKFASPERDLDPVALDLNVYNPKVSNPRNPIAYNSPGSPYACQPGRCAYGIDTMVVEETSETYFFCGGQANLAGTATCSITESSSVVEDITDAGAQGEATLVGDVFEVCLIVSRVRMCADLFVPNALLGHVSLRKVCSTPPTHMRQHSTVRSFSPMTASVKSTDLALRTMNLWSKRVCRIRVTIRARTTAIASEVLATSSITTSRRFMSRRFTKPLLTKHWFEKRSEIQNSTSRPLLRHCRSPRSKKNSGRRKMRSRPGSLLFLAFPSSVLHSARLSLLKENRRLSTYRRSLV